MKIFSALICAIAGSIMNLSASEHADSPIKAIIFDCDGTLIDSEYAHYLAWQHALQNQGSDLSVEEYYFYVGKSLETNARLLATRIDCDCIEKIIEDKKHHYHQLQNLGLPSIQPTIDFIHRLSSDKERLGLKFGIASAARKAEILTNLRHLGIENLFDIILSGSDDLADYNDPEGVNKPKPYIYLHAAKELGLSPSQCIVIEDSSSGVTAGVGAGCFTIAVPNSYTLQQDLSHADLKIESFTDISVSDFFQMVRDGKEHWQLGKFERIDEANPILTPCSESIFHCPLQDKDVHWEGEYIFNPGAVVRDGKVYLIYRAEDNFGVGIGKHTSRLGLAVSSDGVHFQRSGTPVLFPDLDEQSKYEFPGGCEDPRIVETEEGTYVMTYTQWNREVAVLAIATSTDLLNWKKHGYAFENDENFYRCWSKAGSIVCRREGDRLVATKIQGKYWMYWGEGLIHAATSDDLISWTPLLNEDNRLIAILAPREGMFDSALVEAGPPALLTKDGIVLLYNGKNSVTKGDPKIFPKAYSAGQLLLDARDPTRVISRSEECFLTPEKAYEMNGQYNGGTVFIQGLVHFQGNWLLYYGTADAAIGVAISRE